MEGWPPDIRYANSIFYHNGRDELKEEKLPSLLVDQLKIFWVPPNHPAYPGRGVRTTVAIEKGQDVAYYAGIYRPGAVAPDNPYVFGVQPLEKDMVIDALMCGNITRFINDPRGTGRDANLTADDMIVSGHRMELRSVVFSASRDIEPGEELMFSYEASVKGYWNTLPPIVIDLTVDSPPPSTDTTKWIEVTCNYQKCNRCGFQLPECYFTKDASHCRSCREKQWDSFKKRAAHKLTKAMLLKKFQ